MYIYIAIIFCLPANGTCRYILVQLPAIKQHENPFGRVKFLNYRRTERRDQPEWRTAATVYYEGDRNYKRTAFFAPAYEAIKPNL